MIIYIFRERRKNYVKDIQSITGINKQKLNFVDNNNVIKRVIITFNTI